MSTTKARLLALLDILQRFTDAEHSLSINEVIQKLRNQFGANFQVDKRAIQDDLLTLESYGYSIEESVGKYGSKVYSLISRKFEASELRMLIDAVSSARFITTYESRKLIDKLKAFASENQARKLQNEIYLNSRVKCTNNHVRSYVELIHNAITEKEKVRFKYTSYNLQKKLVERHNGKWYCVHPYALAWSNDYYYLIGQDDEAGDIRHFRVDRMNLVGYVKEHFTKKQFDVAEYLNKTFNMYTGDVDEVEIEFDNALLNSVIDRFGEDVTLYPTSQDTFKIRVQAAISEGLVRWILRWGSNAKVLKPDYLFDQIKAEVANMSKVYK